MSFRNKYLYLIVSLIVLAGLVSQFVNAVRDPAPDNRINPISDKITEIRVRHIVRNCACPEWMELDSDSGRFIYLEPAGNDLPDPEIMANRADSLTEYRLQGSFYTASAPPPQPFQEDHKYQSAPLFRFTRLETLPAEEKP